MKKLSLFAIVLIGLAARVECAAVEFNGVFLSPEHVEALRGKVEHKTEPTWSAYQQLLRDADQALEHEPHTPKHWYVPGYYRDAEGHRRAKQSLQDDANDACKMALVFRMTGDERYGRGAAKMARAWATGVEDVSLKDDSTLSFSYHFPALIFAADLIRDSSAWSDEDEKAFRQFLTGTAMRLNTMDRANNWGNWGLVLVMAIAAYTHDEALFETGVARWKELIETQIAENGDLPHEIHRNKGTSGIWYTHFALFPQTIAAEIAKVNGVDLYDYAAPNGRTLRMAFERVVPWVENPAAFPYLEDKSQSLHGVEYVSYFEILNAHWPNPAATAILKRLRPLDATHSAPAMTFTHGE
ncbi:MAG: hypothetical protein GC154_18230 [bacterium]|nr:hypothetical protein [bacterium]